MQPKSFSRRSFLKGSTAAALVTLLPRGSSSAAPTIGPLKSNGPLDPSGLLKPAAGQIIADHTVVAQYADIPQAYIDLVK